jgi:YVTN family beta-propeller protein
LLGQIKAPRPLAGIAISADSRTIVAIDDTEPALFLIDTQSERIRTEMRLKDVPKAAQIARYAPDWSLLAVTSLNSNTVSLIDPSFREQTAIAVGSQPMDMAFHGDELFVACQGDGSVHVIDIPNRRHRHSFAAGTGCESLGFSR